MLRRPSFIFIGVVTCTSLSAWAADSNNYDTSTVMSGVVNSISSWNKGSTGAMTPDPTCKECANVIATHEQCTSQNNYLERDIEKAANSNPILQAVLNRPDKEDILHTNCIQASLEIFGAGNVYHRCNSESGDGRQTSSLTKPCVSESYTNLVAKSFNAAAECLSGYVTESEKSMNKKISTIAIFSMLHVESGLHINAMSGTGAGGPGQFTWMGIHDVNANMPGILDYLSSSTNPICRDTLVKAFQPPMDGNEKTSITHSCERIGISGNNPLKNFLYTFAYQAIAHKQFAGMLKSQPYQNLISNLRAGEQERFISAIATWSHNTGPYGMEVPLRALLAKYLRSGKTLNSPDDVGDFLTQLQKMMKTNPASGNASEGRRDETYRYYSKILSQRSAIESHINGDLSKCYNE